MVLLRSHLQGSRFLNPEDGTDRLSRNVGKNYHYSLPNNPQEGGSQLLRGGSMKSRFVAHCLQPLKLLWVNFMVTPCVKWCRTLYIYQLTHTTLRNVELLKHSKIDKNAPTCFGLHGDHLQGAKVSTWLKHSVHDTHAVTGHNMQP